MVDDERMSLFQEPESSQPPGFYDIQTDLFSSATRTEQGRVKYHDMKAPVLAAIVPQAPSGACSSFYYLLSLPFFISSPLHSDSLLENSTRSSRRFPSVNSTRRPGNANHPAHQSRHAVFLPETQDPERAQAMHQMGDMCMHVVDHTNKTSKRKAERINPSFKDNPSVHSRTALRRRRTTEDVQLALHAPPAKKPALQSRATESRLRSAHPRPVHDCPMNEDEPIAGPSRPLFRRPSLTSYVNAAEDSDEEDDGMPSSTPTPPPKHRVPQRSVSVASSSSPSSASLSKGKYAAFSESPTSLNHVPLARQHSEDPSMSYDSMLDDSASPIEQQSGSQRSTEEEPLSPVVPSPVSLSKHPANAMLPPQALPARALPPQRPRAPSSTRSHAPRPQHSPLPGNTHQSKNLSKPYVPPSSSQAAGPSTSQPARPPRASQQPQRELGMRPYHHGQRPNPNKPYQKLTIKPAPAACAGASTMGVAREPAAVAVQRQRSLSPEVPDPPFAIARARDPTADGAQAQAPQLEMSARRAEPRGDVDMDQDEAGKDADSSYGNISFPFDEADIEEAMRPHDR